MYNVDFPYSPLGEGEECNNLTMAIIEVFKKTLLCIITSVMLYIPFLVCFHFLCAL